MLDPDYGHVCTPNPARTPNYSNSDESQSDFFKKCPPVTAAEEQETHLTHLRNSYRPPGLWELLDGKRNLLHCVLTALAPIKP